MKKRIFSRLMIVLFLGFAGIVAQGTLSQQANADETRSVRLSFAPGKTSRAVKGSITGYDAIEYSIGASAGQQMSVSMRTSNRSSYFNVSFGGQAIFVGSSDGDRFDGILPADGDYKVVVYLMRNAARRMETANFSLNVSISGGRPVARPQPDFADSLAGGPDNWIIQGVPRGDTLNVRSRPSTQSQVVAAFPNGVVLRNLGCRIGGGQRWCQVALPDGGVRGWVNGRFLQEY